MKLRVIKPYDPLTVLIKEEILKESSFDTFNGYDVEQDNVGYHSGQSDDHLKLSKDGTLLAYADITLYQNKVYIKYIESKIKGKGYGTILMEYLADKYGYENLERSGLTPDGVKMRQRLDKKFNFDYDSYKESQSKHLDPSVIEQVKDPLTKQFLTDMVNNGYEKTWEKYLDDPAFKQAMTTTDFNDVSEISTWIKGSATNDHDNEEEPNLYVLQDLASIT